MELTHWQQTYLADLDEVPGLDAEETRLLVGRFAFGAGDDAEVSAVLTALDTSDREWLAVTMFSLGVATGHASEARISRGASVLDLRESVEIEPSRERTVSASALTAAVSAAFETASATLPPRELPHAPSACAVPTVLAAAAENAPAVPRQDLRPSVPAQHRSTYSLTVF